jgi:hypothetical protein
LNVEMNQLQKFKSEHVAGECDCSYHRKLVIAHCHSI